MSWMTAADFSAEWNEWRSADYASGVVEARAYVSRLERGEWLPPHVFPERGLDYNPPIQPSLEPSTWVDDPKFLATKRRLSVAPPMNRRPKPVTRINFECVTRTRWRIEELRLIKPHPDDPT